MVFSGIFGGHGMHHPDALSGLKNFFPPLLRGLLAGPQSSLEMALGWRELSRLKLHPRPVGSLQATTVSCGSLEECQGQSLNCRKPSNLQRSFAELPLHSASASAQSHFFCFLSTGVNLEGTPQ